MVMVIEKHLVQTLDFLDRFMVTMAIGYSRPPASCLELCQDCSRLSLAYSIYQL